MEEEHKIPYRGISNQAQNNDQNANKWLSFKSQYEDIPSRVQIRKCFYEETTSNSRKMRSNKKNPTKSNTYYSKVRKSLASPVYPAKSEDHIFQTAIPNTMTYAYKGLGSRLYNCKFTQDGSSILVTSQTGTSFFNFSEDNQISLHKVIYCNNVNWAITDSDISADNKFMVHSTLSPHFHLFDLEKSKYAGHFNLQEDEDDEDSRSYYDWYSTIRVFSLKLSGDQKEVIAGCGRIGQYAPIQLFDINQNRLKQSIQAHKNDINSICYVDKANSSIFISGSDDNTCKLWDTRILKNNAPVGRFYGHMSGITYVASKEDNHYFISNSKDQSIKMWDLRKSVSEEKQVMSMSFDYRYHQPSATQIKRLKELKKQSDAPDQSVMTFEGHSVSGTLIRCHYSPLYGTGQRYIYSGSADGKVYIYDTVSGDHIACLEIPKDEDDGTTIVRDCAWHPFSQNLISSTFNGEVHRWEYNDLRNSEKIEAETYDKIPEEARVYLVDEGNYDDEENWQDEDDDDEEDYNPEDDEFFGHEEEEDTEEI